ncbi:glycine cleavage system protein GcvH [Candidatus Magnetaquicoccus inordinatus]|uniref:glycine cleavage system protein GcvH n=1 Tax=Candidatus Magnetaquicoccus inordinatus TaxID=2496818 RepID=UPI00102D2910|nr:glycine cleavage system protein GcvH [Candidatus Magnetaquicoccus inordinatus]
MSTVTDFPAALRYTREHEWTRVQGTEVEVGITAYAAQQLGDVVFVELPQVGTRVTAGKPFGVVESVKSVSDLFAPLTGEVTAVNHELETAPERVNDSPYNEGWMIRIQPDESTAVDSLLTANEYANWLKQADAAH